MEVDYRALNSATVKNAYPLPNINDLLDRIQGAKVFTKIDLTQGYHHIRIAEEDVHKTAFHGLYEYTVLPFGLTSAPATFSRLMQDIFRPYMDKFLIQYLDDLLIFSTDEASHVEHVEKVLQVLREHKLYTKPVSSGWTQLIF